MAYLAILEWSIAGEGSPRRYSFDGVRTPSNYYEDRLVSLGSISYELNPFGGGFRVGDLSVVLNNADGSLSQLLGTGTIYNSEITIRFGDDSAGLAAMKSIFYGRVKRFRLADFRLTLTVKDERFGRFNQPMRNIFDTLNRTDFPYLPSNIKEGELIPIVYGSLKSTADLPHGQVPCFLIDAAEGQTKFRYIAAQHECKAITAVYRYGELLASGYTVVTSGGKTYLDFTTDQREINSIFNREYSLPVITGWVSRWLMDEASGSVIADDGAGNSGTLQGTAEWVTTPYGKPAVNLETGYVDFGRPTSLNLLGDFTICIWTDIYYGIGYSPGVIRTIIDNGEVLNTKGWKFWWTDLHEFSFRTNTSGANQVTKSSAAMGYAVGDAPGDGRFLMLTVRCTSGVIDFWYGTNKVSDLGGYSSQPTHTAPVTPTDSFKLGSATDAETSRASYKQMRVYSTALSDADIIALNRLPYSPDALTRQGEIEITADIDGITDDGTTTGNLLTTPPEQMQDFLDRCGVAGGSINSTIFAAATSHAVAKNYRGAFVLFDKDMELAAALADFVSSWNMPLIIDEDGKYGTLFFHIVDAANDGTIEHLTDGTDILRGSFAEENMEEPASLVRYNFNFQNIRQQFEDREEREDTAETALLGRKILDPRQLDMFHVHDLDPAYLMAISRLALKTSDRLITTAEFPISHFNKRLGKLFYISHRYGADSSGGGYTRALFRLFGLSITLSAKSMKVASKLLKMEADADPVAFFLMPGIVGNYEATGQMIGFLEGINFGAANWEKLVQQPLYWALRANR